MSLPACASADYPNESTVHNQVESSFFSAPLEVRRVIYGHVFTLAGQHILRRINNNNDDDDDRTQEFILTPCTAPCIQAAILDGQNTGGLERRCTRSESRLESDYSPIYKRRLASTWGPHWLCEELAFRWKHEHYPQEKDNLLSASSRSLSSLLRVCKRM